MSNMISWKAFRDRRKLDLRQILKSNNITKYEDAVAYFARYQVAPPPEDEFVIALGGDTSGFELNLKPEDVEPAAVKKTATRRKRASPKTKAAAKSEDVEKVWQDGVEGSYEADASAQTKKAPAKKRATTRKRTTTRKKKA